MDSQLPFQISSFQHFLQSQGMMERANSVLPMQSHILEYANDKIGIRLHKERGVWEVLAGESATDAWHWYPMTLFPELLLHEPERPMSLPEQLAFAEDNWPRITKAFSYWYRKRTYRRLETFRKERANRRLEAMRLSGATYSGPNPYTSHSRTTSTPLHPDPRQ
jgi:hypothetical protein